ncbi:MAG: AzlD domain-containing protein [Spirochaetaceae bacterium]|nr:MAG: AzlD domain-containing protein [Spirochaetaceae bacterium]
MIWLLLAGMFLVTYIPRLLPFLFAGELALPPWVRKWLRFFPYAALGALIFPGILGAIPGKPALAAGAGLLAAICALFIRNITVIVVLAIVAVLLFQNLEIW